MKKRLLAIIAAGFACSSQVPEYPKDTTRLPIDLPALVGLDELAIPPLEMTLPPESPARSGGRAVPVGPT